MDKFYVDINLCRRAIIQYSSDIWKRPELQEHLAKTSIKREIDEKDTIPPDLHDELNNLILPHGIKDELKLGVGTMGTRIRDWLRLISYCKVDARWTDYVDYIDHIHWTHYSCIDTAQTTKSLYQSGLLPITYGTWYFLCKQCIEECVVDFWEKISINEEYTALVLKISSRQTNQPYICHYWRLRVQNNLDKWKDNIYDYDDLKTVDEYMFKKCCESHYSSFPHFWNRLDDDQRKPLLRKIFISRGIFYCNWLTGTWEQEIDLFMFIMRQYSIYGFENVPLGSLASSMLSKAMIIWPCQNIFMSALEQSCLHFFSWKSIVKIFLDLMCIERAYVGSDSRTRQWFYRFWTDRDNPKYNEIKGAKINSVYIIRKYNNIELLKYVVHHEKSMVERQKILDHIVVYYHHRNLEVLRRFIDEVSREVDVKPFCRQKLVELGVVIEDL